MIARLIKMLKKQSKGFTLVELMVVVAILGVLMAIVMPAVTGTKEVSTEGQVKSDGQSVQKAVDNFNNKSIRPKFPSVNPNTSGHIYEDIWGVGSGADVFLVNKEGTASTTLNAKVMPSGKTAEADKVYQRQFIKFGEATQIYDSDGSVKGATFVPDFLMKEPGSLPLKGDETYGTGKLSAADNTYEEFLWLLLVNAPGTSQESRTVEVYRMIDTITISGTTHTTTTTGTKPATKLVYQKIF